ncbi:MULTISPECIES: hypothetical protein [Burkholderia]|uniref:hypothetical protein n=1 Tax=Burkholderia TaxID=32008 RepID=UPI001177B4C9|nr:MULTISPECIES: hypothetical protein [Burkholderia]MBY4725682.1 hypothetical protein [Burkholderia contaminans]MCI3968066.1 hypothetical protein [Burkholderia sp. HI4860]MDN7788431.1 hypothetical protein [Burkholderia contaminans]
MRDGTSQMATVGESPAQKKQRAKVRGLLKRMLDYAVTCRLISATPVMALPMRHVYKAVARERALPAEDIKQCLQVVHLSNVRRQFKIRLPRRISGRAEGPPTAGAVQPISASWRSRA